MKRKLKRLFEPISIGNMELKNRLKMLAMAVSMNIDEGISDQILAFYAERSRGGVAIIGISCTATRLIDDPMLGLYHDRFVPGLKKLVDVIHRDGALGGAVFSRYFYSPSFTRWFLKFDFPFKKRIAIMGSSYAGLELGETLTDSGKHVAIIEESRRVGSDVGTVHRWVFLDKLRKANAKIKTNAKVMEIVKGGVMVKSGETQELVAADTVVNVKMAKNTEFTGQFGGMAKTIHVIGDGAEPGLVMEAMTFGFMTGEKV